MQDFESKGLNQTDNINSSVDSLEALNTQNIDLLIERWWPTSPESITYRDLIRDQLSENDDGSLSEKFEQYVSRINAKLMQELGPEESKRYEDLIEELVKRENRGEDISSIITDINSLVFDHNISNWFPSETALRGQAALRAMIPVIQSLGEIELVDLGCGDGLVGLGLLQCCPNINRYIGIDNNPSAIRRATFQSERIPEHDLSNLSQKIFFHQADMFDPSVIEGVRTQSATERKVFLMSFGQKGPPRFIENFPEVVGLHSEMIFCHPVEFPAEYGRISLEDLPNLFGEEWDSTYPMQLIYSDEYMPGHYIVVGRYGLHSPTASSEVDDDIV